MSEQGAPSAGWYPDPDGGASLRYYDGTNWTDQYQQGDGSDPDRSPIEHWKTVLTEKYFDFSGRSRRAEYWWYTAVNLGILVVLSVVGGLVASTLFTILISLFYLAIVIPSLAVGIRRLHDTSRSGWWLLISIVPLIGSIVLLVFLCTDSHRQANQWGRSPKYG